MASSLRAIGGTRRACGHTRALLGGCLWFFLISPATGLGQTGSGYGDLNDWTGWARVRRGVHAGLASSFDRAGGNADFSQYESETGLVSDARTVTAATLDGPGIIYRFWMPHYTALQNFAIRLYFDGETTPRIDSDSVALLSGPFGYFSAPLLTTGAGGQVLYEPIAFRTSLHIETVNKVLPASGSWSPNRHYYQYSWLRFPQGTDIASYTGVLAPEVQAARNNAINLLNNPGAHPAPNPSAFIIAQGPAVLSPGASLVLADLSTSGLVRRIALKADQATGAGLENLSLRVWYDGAITPAIDVPVAYYFGAGAGRVPYRSMPLGTHSPDGFYSHWPMPFRRAIRVSLHNTGPDAIPIDSALVEYKPTGIPGDLAYLHAHFASSVRTTTSQTQHTLLTDSGMGHYVGNLLYIQQPNSDLRMLEGDESIRVDGTTVLQGTGTEDAYNGGYYYNWVAIQTEPEGPRPASVIRPLHGILHVSSDATAGMARADQYRWQIADRVPFFKSIDIRMETLHAVIGAQYRSVAFWYRLAAVPGDSDADADVDVLDFASFRNCASGAAIPQPRTDCARFDFDGDSDVDASDFGVFQRCFTGSEAFGDVLCTD